MKRKYLAFGTIVIALACIGCSVTYPLGEAGRYGSVKATVEYLPPVDLWQSAPRFLADK